MGEVFIYYRVLARAPSAVSQGTHPRAARGHGRTGATVAMTSLAEKAGTLRLQLGLPDDRTLTETVDEAVTQLGLAKEVAGLPLIQKADACISTMMGSAPVQAVAIGEAFIGAESFSGARAGYVFKNGSKGIGYYLDSTSSASSDAGAAPPSGLAAVVPSTLLDALMSPAAAAGDEYVALRSAIHASAGAVGGLIYGNMHPGVAPRRAAAAGAAIGVTIALAEGSFAVRLMSWVSQPHGDAGEQATESTPSTSTDSQ